MEVKWISDMAEAKSFEFPIEERKVPDNACIGAVIADFFRKIFGPKIKKEKAKIMDIHQQSKAMKDLLDEERKNIEQLKEKNKKLDSKNCELEMMIIEKDKQIKALEDENRLFKQQLSEANLKIKNIETFLGDEKKMREVLEIHLKKQMEELKSSKDKEIDDLRTKVEELKAENESKNNEISELREDVESLRNYCTFNIQSIKSEIKDSEHSRQLLMLALENCYKSLQNTVRELDFQVGENLQLKLLVQDGFIREDDLWNEFVEYQNEHPLDFIRVEKE